MVSKSGKPVLLSTCLPIFTGVVTKGTIGFKGEDLRISASFFVCADPVPVRPKPLPNSVVNVLSAE